MTKLHFRDLRRRVDRLEDRYLPVRPIRVVFEFVDKDGNIELFDSFVVGEPAHESDAEIEACDGEKIVSLQGDSRP